MELNIVWTQDKSALRRKIAMAVKRNLILFHFLNFVQFFQPTFNKSRCIPYYRPLHGYFINSGL